MLVINDCRTARFDPDKDVLKHLPGYRSEVSLINGPYFTIMPDGSIPGFEPLKKGEWFTLRQTLDPLPDGFKLEEWGPK